MLNNIFGQADGTVYNMNWVPLIYYISFEGIIFNWEVIISDNLSSSVAFAQGGITQKRYDLVLLTVFYACTCFPSWGTFGHRPRLFFMFLIKLFGHISMSVFTNSFVNNF